MNASCVENVSIYALKHLYPFIYGAFFCRLRQQTSPLFCLSLIIFNKTYTVVNFDVEQGRIIIRENPKYLSLNEMYQVANSYPKGSKAR